MNDTVFLPKVIRVGYQERSDTYTGKLAYVIYIDQDDKVRKEHSWHSWRSDDIKPDDYKNIPTSGFVLNKKAGGTNYGWNSRQTYVRVYDPRGFEFEMSVPNLLYILENATSTKGKGLEGEFVYGWDGTDILLIPVGAYDYKDIAAYSHTMFNPQRFKGKDLILGATYKTNKNAEWVYLGRFDKHGSGKVKKAYFFQNGDAYETVASLTKRIVQCVSSEPVANYAELMDELQHHTVYSPVAHNKAEYIQHTDAELDALFADNSWCNYIHIAVDGVYVSVRLYQYRTGSLSAETDYWGNKAPGQSVAATTLLKTMNYAIRNDKLTYKDLHKQYPFMKKNEYLKNGKLKH